MSHASLPSKGRIRLAHAFTAVTAVVCAGLVTAAALVPAPPVVLPFAALICIGCPMLAAWDLARALSARHGRRAADPALNEFRRTLDALPETSHPLGL